MPDIDDVIDSLPDDLQSVTDVIDKSREVLNQNPAVRALVVTGLAKLQDLIRDAGLSDPVDKPQSVDEIRAAARGAVSNLQASQSSLEKFIEWGLDTSEDAIAALVELLQLDD